MTARLAATLAAVFAGLAVAFGAFGAHALRARLDQHALDVFETAVRYQMYHAFALFVAAALISRGLAHASTAAWAFTAGIVLFSGSLYGLALSGQRWLGPITPLGGIAFLAGWVLLALAARRL